MLKKQVQISFFFLYGWTKKNQTAFAMVLQISSKGCALRMWSIQGLWKVMKITAFSWRWTISRLTWMPTRARWFSVGYPIHCRRGLMDGRLHRRYSSENRCWRSTRYTLHCCQFQTKQSMLGFRPIWFPSRSTNCIGSGFRCMSNYNGAISNIQFKLWLFDLKGNLKNYYVWYLSISSYHTWLPFHYEWQMVKSV